MKSLLLAATAVTAITTSVVADETLKYRSAYVANSFQAQDIGDVPGHTMGLSHISGVASFPDGSVASDSFVAATEYAPGGNGQFHLLGVLTFADGSALFYETNGTVTVEGSHTNNKGVVKIRGGKGRFADAKGEGTVAGQRLQVVMGAGAALYVDAVLTIKK
jgi:hypothetical protein